MRITVKVGTSTLTHATGRLNIQRIEKLCKVLSDLKNAGHEIILVSSGAIGMGVGKLNLPGRPADMPGKQAAAAVGQCELIYTYDKLFGEYNHTVAQLLITAPDIEEGGVRKQNFHNTLERLLEKQVAAGIAANRKLGEQQHIAVHLLRALNDGLRVGLRIGQMDARHGGHRTDHAGNMSHKQNSLRKKS